VTQIEIKQNENQNLREGIFTKQTDSLKQIEMLNENESNDYVNYKNKLKPKLNFENEELKTLYFQHKSELLAMAEKEALKYLMDFGAWDYEPEEMFPSGKVLTGEWYIGSISMKDNKTIRGSIEMRFTAYYDTPSTAQIDDYLGMECWFDYDPETQTFMFDCFDTSVI